MDKRKKRVPLLLCICFAIFFTACGTGASSASLSESLIPAASAPQPASGSESAAPAALPEPEPEPTRPVAQAIPYLPQADGLNVQGGTVAVIDASHADDGYFMVNYIGSNQKPRMIISTPSGTEYRYYLHAGVGYQTFPLTQGSGTYTVNILENAGGDSYYFTDSASFTANISDDHTLFLYPNQFVDFNEDTALVSTARELAEGCKDDLALVERAYTYTMEQLTYDDYKAATVKSGYVPAIDEVLAQGTGICFDYASVLATILRSQGIPTKLQVGNAYNPGDPSNPIYHAWVSVYTDETGWINGIIQFDGVNWRLMDPTFADDEPSDFINSYITNSDNYTVIYEY